MGHDMRRSARPRPPVSPRTLAVLLPLFHYSAVRNAYILRLVGHRVGPVLRLECPRQESNLRPTA